MMKRHAGFTLAEVLITLGIIGVVAAMTIPTLMSNTGRAEFKTAFKKVVSAVNQAVTLSVAVDYLDFGDANTGISDANGATIYQILNKKMQIAKTNIAKADDDVNRMFGSTGDSNYTIFFADGMVLSYDKDAQHCTNFLKPGGNQNGDGDKCKAIVDVNGVKNPNKLSHCQWEAAKGTTSTVKDDKKAGTGEGGGSFCQESNAFISDQYSVRFKGQQLIPNGYAARYVLYEK